MQERYSDEWVRLCSISAENKIKNTTYFSRGYWRRGRQRVKTFKFDDKLLVVIVISESPEIV